MRGECAEEREKRRKGRESVARSRERATRTTSSTLKRQHTFFQKKEARNNKTKKPQQSIVPRVHFSAICIVDIEKRVTDELVTLLQCAKKNSATLGMDENAAIVAVNDLEGEKHSAEYEDAYVAHFKMVLRAILYEREDFVRLYSARERAVAESFLNDLQPMEQQLYARIFQRKGPWFKTTSLFRYFANKSDVAEQQQRGKSVSDESPGGVESGDVDEGDDSQEAADASEAPEQVANAVVQTALRALIKQGFLVTLPVGAGTTPCMFFGSASAGVESQDEETLLAHSLDALQQCAAAPELAALQRKLTGSAAKKKSSPSPASNSNVSSRSSSKAGAFHAIKKVVLTQRRIDGSRIPLASLMHQIWFESYPLPGKTKSDVMVVQMPDSHRDLFLRMHRLFYFQSSIPFNYPSSSASGKPAKEVLGMLATKIHQEPTRWPGLMVIFKKTAYPTYEIQVQYPAFPSPEAYLCFEVASRLHHIMGMVEQHLVIEIPEEQEPDLDIKWMMGDISPKFVAFQKLIETDDDGFEILPDESSSEATTDWQMESWVQFRAELGKMASLDDFVLEARRCFQAFLLWTNSYARTGGAQEMPVFFSKCNAGYHLARVLHHAGNLYEKQRQYQVAILLLNDLLASPFLQRKRGYWWERLALNLEHLKCVDQARSACANALNDPHVVGADLIALSRRMRRLQKRVAAKENPSQQQVCDPDVDDFVSLISDEEAEVDASIRTSTIPPLVEEYVYPKEYIVGRPLNRQVNEKSRFIGYDDEPCTVEQLVLQHYHSQRSPRDHERGKGGWYGVHCEGHIVGNLFGLFMWDILYASVPNVFQTPFQAAPLDFGYAEAFYESRKEAIEARLRQLQEQWCMQQVLEDLGRIWRREYGKVSRFVSWPDEQYLPLRFFELVVLAWGQERLTKLMRYMLTSREYHRAQNGLPDLLVVRAEPKVAGFSTELPLDEHGCLDIYSFCGMTYQMNLNERTNSEVAVPNDQQQEEETKTRNSIVDLLDLDDWTVQLKLVEVKGPRDSLSDKQLIWLQVLNEEVGLEAIVTHVVEDDKTLEKKLKPIAAKAKKATSTGRSEPKRKAKRPKK